MPEKVEKIPFFSALYDEIDSKLNDLKISNEPIKKDNWRQIRKVIGEYVANLYYWDKAVTWVDFEIDRSNPVEASVQIVYDGNVYDQASRIETIQSGLNNLEAVMYVASGSLRDYPSLAFKVKL